MTAQLTNNIFIEGHEYSLASDPLKPYLEENDIKIEGYMTTCWNGYLSDWDIIDNKLYLIDVFPCFTDEEGENIMSMENLFPEQDRVFAHWYSGELTIQKGELLNYVHMGYESAYEEHFYIKIEDGIVVDTWVEDNRDKEFGE